MAWRVHFSDQPVRRLDRVAGTPTLLAAWMQGERGDAESAGRVGERVALFDLATGEKVDERTLQYPAQTDLNSAEWKTHLLTLTAPNTQFLPLVRTPLGLLFTAQAGKERVLCSRAGELAFWQDEQRTPLDTGGKPIIAVALGGRKKAADMVDVGETQPTAPVNEKASSGDDVNKPASEPGDAVKSGDTAAMATAAAVITPNAEAKPAPKPTASKAKKRVEASPVGEPLIAAMDSGGKIYLFRGLKAIGAFEVGLTPGEDMRPMLAVADEADQVFATDGAKVVMLDGTGKVAHTQPLYYTPGTLAPSPDGTQLAVTDLENYVIRVYDAGGNFAITHQRFGIDLMADARRMQGKARSVTAGGVSGAALGPAIMPERGTLAFAMGGAVCVTSLTRMKAAQSA